MLHIDSVPTVRSTCRLGCRCVDCLKACSVWLVSTERIGAVFADEQIIHYCLGSKAKSRNTCIATDPIITAYVTSRLKHFKCECDEYLSVLDFNFVRDPGLL